MCRVVTITITDTPAETAAIGAALRKFLLAGTPTFVFDNCGCGSEDEPRRLEAHFPQVWRNGQGKRTELEQVR